MLCTEVVQNRDVIWFIDNEAAAAALIRGSCREDDVSQIVLTARLFFFFLNCRMWIEWVDSISNPADGLSRDGLLDDWTQKQGWTLVQSKVPEWFSADWTPVQLWCYLR